MKFFETLCFMALSSVKWLSGHGLHLGVHFQQMFQNFHNRSFGEIKLLNLLKVVSPARIFNATVSHTAHRLVAGICYARFDRVDMLTTASSQPSLC